MGWPTTSRYDRGYGTAHDNMRERLIVTVILCEKCSRQGRVTVGERMLEWQADEMRAEPHRCVEIVDYLIEEGILADHMAALRWMASLDLPLAA